ncbi:hypothetical protein AB0F72_30855 [Actinoplanes sp. NPDC023936]|uniref:hypothetical protein n=1 Tax=Actinoplanes sp. NPDC023936 TaxID=3154910 RepID=UPI0033C8A69D
MSTRAYGIPAAVASALMIGFPGVVVSASAAASAPAVAAASADEPTVEEMRDALLGPADMPGGYTGTDYTGTYSGVASACDELYLGTVDNVVRTFTHTGRSLDLSEEIAAVGYDRSSEVVDAWAAIPDDCPDKQYSSGYWNTSRWPLPSLGDASVGLVSEVRNDDELLSRVTTAMIAYGDVVVHLKLDQNVTRDKTPFRRTDAEFRRIVRAAVAKIEESGIG